ncbi:MAG: YoaK family protein [Candidatus Binataceae bacterium]
MLGEGARTKSEGGRRGLSPVARRDLLLLLLTWAAGFVDAISYLGLGNVFTANMTGNTILLGIALGRGAHLAAFRASLALAGFCIGATVGALIVMRSDRPVVWPSSITQALALEFAALIAFALGWRWEGARGLPNSGVIESLIMLSAFAMGVQSAAVRRIGVSAVTSTAVTGTLAGVMAGAVGWLHGSVGLSGDQHDRAHNTSPGFGLSASVWGVYAFGGLAGGTGQVRWHSACAWVAAGGVGLVIATAAILWRQSSGERA